MRYNNNNKIVTVIFYDIGVTRVIRYQILISETSNISIRRVASYIRCTNQIFVFKNGGFQKYHFTRVPTSPL